jgi:hypothetical protein
MLDYQSRVASEESIKEKVPSSGLCLHMLWPSEIQRAHCVPLIMPLYQRDKGVIPSKEFATFRVSLLTCIILIRGHELDGFDRC